MTTARKLALLVLSAVLGIAVLTTWFLVSERQLILEERQTGVRQVVESAHGIATHFHDLSTKGGMPDDEARKRAAAAIQAVRYSGNEYVWINDMHPRMVMHPIRPELNGQDLTANKDPNGKQLFVEFVRTVQASGAGFVPYLWPKAGSDTPVEKTSYVKGFAPLGLGDRLGRVHRHRGLGHLAARHRVRPAGAAAGRRPAGHRHADLAQPDPTAGRRARLCAQHCPQHLRRQPVGGRGHARG